jgi:hypothetical protein
MENLDKNLKGFLHLYLVGASLFILAACNGENAPDCFQNAGDLVREELEVPIFDKVTVFEQARLVIRHGPVQKVEVETGEYLRDEVSAVVTEGRLVVRNDNKCNLFRDYGLTTFYITVPDLTEIRSSTGLVVQSDGVLPFESLDLYSESFNSPATGTTDGSFDLELAVQSLRVVANGLAYFRIRGAAVEASLAIAAGDSRIEADELAAQYITVDHRGSNDLHVKPQSALRGVIRGTGDVVSFNRPDTVEVDILYKGRLLFRE